jgi:hypothetical protein
MIIFNCFNCLSNKFSRCNNVNFRLRVSGVTNAAGASGSDYDWGIISCW